MTPKEIADSLNYDQLAGLTIHERVKKTTNLLARGGYRVTRLTLPSAMFSLLEYVPYPLLTGCDTGLALMLLGEKVPLFARYDATPLVRFDFHKLGEAQVIMALDIDLDPPKVA